MNTIKLYLHAGLCNQLFMIFTVISYSIDNCFNFLIYSKKHRTIENGTPAYWDSFLDKLKDKVIENIDFSIPLYQEPTFHYTPIVKLQQDFNIKGYFQSEKYFKHNYSKILEIIDFHTKQEQVKNKYIDFFKRKTIAMHFRFGDYIHLQDNHPLMKPIYYENALKYLEDNLNNIKDNYDILYFCQEIDNDTIKKYYIDVLNKDRKYNFIKVPDKIPDWEQLLMMSLCDNFVIANSSFSWFGAYFCKNENKIVLYPSIWFGKALADKNTKDIAPATWIKIEAL